MLSMVMKSDGVRSVGKTPGIVDCGGEEDDNVNFDVGDGVVKVEDGAEVLKLDEVIDE